MRFESNDGLLHAIQNNHVAACGITSSFTVDYNETVRTAARIESVDPGIFIFVGGHHPTLCASDFNVPAVNVVVMGEGEVTSPELIRCLKERGNLKDLAGLTLNLDGTQFSTLSRGFVRRLDSFPPPARGLVEKYSRRYRLMVSSRFPHLRLHAAVLIDVASAVSGYSMTRK